MVRMGSCRGHEFTPVFGAHKASDDEGDSDGGEGGVWPLPGARGIQPNGAIIKQHFCVILVMICLLIIQYE